MNPPLQVLLSSHCNDYLRQVFSQSYASQSLEAYRYSSSGKKRVTVSSYPNPAKVLSTLAIPD
jgi:hypothetical protein